MKKRTIAVILFAIVISLIVFLVLQGSKSSIQSSKIKILATTTQLADITSNLTGNLASIDLIFKPNIDPHEYDPSADDVKKIYDADLIVQNGANLEHKIQNSINDAPAKKFVATDYVVTLKGDDGTDPHIWFSVKNVKAIVSNLKDTLIQLDPANKEQYLTNEQNYQRQLDDLDSFIRSEINSLPIGQRKLVTSHDAFGYYTNEYGLQFVGAVIPSLSTEAEPSAQEISDLVNLVKQEKVKTIFSEKSVSPKLSEQVAQEANVKIISTLYGDTLGEAGSEGDSYIKMMKYDTVTIVDNLK